MQVDGDNAPKSFRQRWPKTVVLVEAYALSCIVPTIFVAYAWREAVHSGGWTDFYFVVFGTVVGVVLAGGMHASIFINAHKSDIEQWRRDHGLCRKCGYDMRATPQRCPECGTKPIATC